MVFFVSVDCGRYEISNEDDFNKLTCPFVVKFLMDIFKQIHDIQSLSALVETKVFDVEDDDIYKDHNLKCNEWLMKLTGTSSEDTAEQPRRYRIEGDGEWGIAEGLIYEKVRFEDFDIDATEQSQESSLLGLDFGFTDPNALVV